MNCKEDAITETHSVEDVELTVTKRSFTRVKRKDFPETVPVETKFSLLIVYNEQKDEYHIYNR